MSATNIYAAIENGDEKLVISGSLRLLREYQPDAERCAQALLSLLSNRKTASADEAPAAEEVRRAGDEPR